MVHEMRNIESDFFKQFNFSNMEQNLNDEDKKDVKTKAMKKFAIQRMLILF